MNIIERIKRFWARRVLRKIYDPDGMLPIPIEKLNTKELKLYVSGLNESIEEIKDDLSLLIDHVSDNPTQCDKCIGYTSEEYCFKCDNTGIISNKQLFKWPW